MPAPSKARAGLSAADVVVGLFLVSVVFLFLIMAATRARESARLMTCQRNLAQIGQALAYYDGAFGGLPSAQLARDGEAPGEVPPGPLKAMLDALGVASFLGLDDKGTGVGAPRETASAGVPVAGFLCPADQVALGHPFPSPISYRACTGADEAGTDGPFALGRRTSLAEVERRDGAAYTAAFAERLIGDGRPQPSPRNYFVPGIAGPPKSSGDVSWRGDAGSTWTVSDFRYTLYNHSKPPNHPETWVADDGATSTMGASSSHVRGLNMLMLDGSARIVAPSIDPAVWTAFGTLGPEPERSDPRG